MGPLAALPAPDRLVADPVGGALPACLSPPRLRGRTEACSWRHSRLGSTPAERFIELLPQQAPHDYFQVKQATTSQEWALLACCDKLDTMLRSPRSS